MQRTNIYLDERQLETLKHLAATERSSVATLVRRAVDDYLSRQTARRAELDAQLDALLAELHAKTAGVPLEEIEAEITAARQEVREMRRAQRAARGR